MENFIYFGVLIQYMVISAILCYVKNKQLKAMISRCTKSAFGKVIGFIEHRYLIEVELFGETKELRLLTNKPLAIGDKVEILYNPNDADEYYTEGLYQMYDIKMYIKHLVVFILFEMILIVVLNICG